MKKTLEIMGTVLIACALVYVLLGKKETKKNKINTRTKKSSKDFPSDNNVSIMNRNDKHDENFDFDHLKASAVETMYSRHEEASNIIREAVDIICSRTEIAADENDDLDNLSDELDKLLSEELR